MKLMLMVGSATFELSVWHRDWPMIRRHILTVLVWGKSARAWGWMWSRGPAQFGGPGARCQEVILSWAGHSKQWGGR